jgi:hypothetical protein
MRMIGSTQSRRQLRDAGRSLFAGSAQVAPIMSVSNRIGKEHVFCAHPVVGLVGCGVLHRLLRGGLLLFAFQASSSKWIEH